MAAKDLANLNDLTEYLQTTPFASSAIHVLTGGTGNFACRLQLLSPYQGRYPFSLERQKFEVEALRIVEASIPSTSFVSVPKVHFFDEKESVIIMDDCGVHSTTLKQFVLDRKCTSDLADKIGSQLGMFLRLIHGINRERNPDVCDVFAGNAEAKRISAWATYGRLVSTLNGKDALPALIDPALHIEEEDMKMISEVVERTSTMISEAKDTFTMGDFWPGNILLSLDPHTGNVEGIDVVDWELSKTGLPGLDLGQFTAEVDLLRKFYPSFEDSGTKMIGALYGSYSASEDVARTAAIHWGAHLIAWTPRVHWGEKEDTRVMVANGVKLMVNGRTGPNSLINDMFKLS
ncbi:hypothetical protein BT96DRAFT_984905 [Gymnopus androsaceus JB14]|uniref:Aminoglycoside phosphotransferase domain-containing protein n=1 Tax=Gymnopus androsaceus JB14 TaxID=1447944 RepID=A0A6A4IAK0_9AGAR|nr:hypothetical protein BT96DRAFT_984905 [Gymnopus androsaceus JB14]